MRVEPEILVLTFCLLGALTVLAVPLAVAVFFSFLLLLFLTPDPLPADFVFSYSLSMRLNSPALISIPLFAVAGELAIAAGITDRLLDVADCLCRGKPNSTGERTVFGCLFYATVSGVGSAAVNQEGSRLLPAMIRAGTDRAASAGLLAAAAGLSIIIPASIPLTIYAATVGIQTNIVFAASFVPGLVVASAIMAVVLIRNRHGGVHHDTLEPDPLPLVRALRRASWAIALPVLVLTALFTGIFTAPEAASFAAAYALLIGIGPHRRIRLTETWDLFAWAGTGAATVLLLAGVGGLAARLLDSCGFIVWLTNLVFTVAGGRTGSILAINLAFLIAGCFMDMPAVISLVVPLFLPLAARCGLTPAHFGALVAVNLAIGLITPPQAMNLAAAARLAGIDLRSAARGGAPYLLAMLAALFLISFMPGITLWLPDLLGWTG